MFALSMILKCAINPYETRVMKPGGVKITHDDVFAAVSEPLGFNELVIFLNLVGLQNDKYVHPIWLAPGSCCTCHKRSSPVPTLEVCNKF